MFCCKNAGTWFEDDILFKYFEKGWIEKDMRTGVLRTLLCRGNGEQKCCLQSIARS